MKSEEGKKQLDFIIFMLELGKSMMEECRRNPSAEAFEFAKSMLMCAKFMLVSLIREEVIPIEEFPELSLLNLPWDCNPEDCDFCPSYREGKPCRPGKGYSLE